MILIIPLIIILCIPGFRIKKETNTDYFNQRTTASFIGLFVLCIFFSHVLGRINSSNLLDVPATYFFQTLISQMMVVPFFFFSAYGIICQYNKMGRDKYLKRFLVHRFLRVYLIFLLCELFGALICGLCSGFKDFNFDPLRLTCWYGPWFIFVILALYLIIFLSLVLFGHRKLLIFLSVLILSFVLIAILVIFKEGDYWYNTIISFPIGVAFALYKSHIDNFLLSIKKRFLFITLLVCFLGYLAVILIMKYIPPLSYNLFNYLSLYTIRVVLFILCMTIFLFLFTFGNKILFIASGLGLYSYILQGFSFYIFSKVFDLISISIHLYCVLCFITTSLFSLGVKFLFDKLFALSLGKLAK